MGLFGNIKDAVRQRMDDPPKYRGSGDNLRRAGGTSIFEAVEKTFKAASVNGSVGTLTSSASSDGLATVEKRADRGLKLNPNHFDSLHLKGLVLVVKGDLIGAAEYLEKARSRRPSHSDVVSLLVDVYEKLGQSDKARAITDEYVSLMDKREKRKDTLKFGAIGFVGAAIAEMTGIEIGGEWGE